MYIKFSGKDHTDTHKYTIEIPVIDIHTALKFLGYKNPFTAYPSDLITECYQTYYGVKGLFFKEFNTEKEVFIFTSEIPKIATRWDRFLQFLRGK